MTHPGTGQASTEGNDEMFPIVSTLDRGARMTQLPPGRSVGRFTGRLFARVLMCTTVWALVFSALYAALLGLAPTSVGSPWSMGVALIITYFALSSTIVLSERTWTTFGQARVAGLLTSTVVAGGFALSACGWLIISYSTVPQPAFDLHNIATSTTIPRELGAMVGAAAALWAVVALGRLVPALHHARSRQQTIDRLRRTGIRHTGKLSALDFRNTWLRDQPIFRIEVAYTAGGESRIVPLHMRTSADRVPVLSSPMVVLTDGAGSVHVDLDHSAGIEFEKDDGRYRACEG